MSLNQPLRERIKIIAQAHNLDPSLLASIVLVESSGNPYAIRYEAKWEYFYKVDEHARRHFITPETEMHLQKFSWGLCQIMGSVARECLFIGEMGKLFDEETNLNVGCVKLKKIMKRYDRIEDGIAAYNSGVPRFMANGKYFNQSYVNRVMAHYLEFQMKGL